MWVKEFDFSEGVMELQATGADLLAINETLEQHGIKPEILIRKPDHVPGYLWYGLSDASKVWLSHAELVEEDPSALSLAFQMAAFCWHEPRDTVTLPRVCFEFQPDKLPVKVHRFQSPCA
jgi:hypothetical protein